jgi:hypothetical protein
MKNFARILTTFILLLIAQNFYSQANNNNKTVELENQNLKFKADNIIENKTTGIITLFGNAALMSDSINFEGAEKIINPINIINYFVEIDICVLALPLLVFFLHLTD